MLRLSTLDRHDPCHMTVENERGCRLWSIEDSTWTCPPQQHSSGAAERQKPERQIRILSSYYLRNAGDRATLVVSYTLERRVVPPEPAKSFERDQSLTTSSPAVKGDRNAE
jgi:hypothetical protein